MKKLCSLLIGMFFLCMCCITASAQSSSLSGEVKDSSGTGIPSVTVQVTSTRLAATTDANGKFTISNVPAKGKLVIHHVGYKDKEVSFNDHSFISITLTETVSNLNDVVVVGYGRQKKVSLVGAISAVTSKDLKQSPVSDLTNALAGRLPGLFTQQTSGAPGYSSATLQVRGFGTFAGGTSPLTIVDGVERPFSQIDAREVESISILKDASATAVYGVRGANGVIIVTTKRGTKSKPTVDISLQNSIQRMTRIPNFLGSYDYARLYNEASLNDGLAAPYTADDLQKYKDHSDPYFHPDVDWYKAVLKPSTSQRTANINVSGGTDFAKYFVSGSFLTENGFFRYGDLNDYNTNAQFTRYNFRSNVDLNITKDFITSVNLSARNEMRNEPGVGVDGIFSFINRIPPNTMPVFNPDGSLAANSIDFKNPIGEISRTGYTRSYTNVLELSVILNHRLDFITKGLYAKVNMSYDNEYLYRQVWSKSYQTVSYTQDANGDPVYMPTSHIETPLSFSSGFAGSRDNRADPFKHVYLEGSLNYDRTFGKHGVTGLLLYNRDRRTYNSEWPYSLEGFVGRVTYNFYSRYFLEYNVGYNGTDQFAKGSRFGYFPSYALGWLVSEEPWMKKHAPFINLLKVRGSYGEVGNDKLNSGRRFLFFPDSYTDVGTYNFGVNGSPYSGYGEAALGNPTVTWEKAKKKNIGIDLEILKGMFAVTADIFQEDRSDILLTRQDVPGLVGVTQGNLPPVNLGIMTNHGFELEVSHKYSINKNFRYFVKGNISFARNKIQYNTQAPLKYAWLPAGNGAPYGTEGYNLKQNFGFVSEGFFNSQDEIANWASQSNYGVTQPGNIKYKDLNGDGVIDANDQQAVGYPTYPEIMYGASIGFSYKNFDFSMLFQGAANCSIYISNEVAWPFFNSAKVTDIVLGRWTPATAQTANYPILTTHSNSNSNDYVASDFWLRNGAYTRLKNVEIGYTLNRKFLAKYGLTNFRIFFTGLNLLTWDHFKVFDPEGRDPRGWQYPQSKVYNMGINLSF